MAAATAARVTDEKALGPLRRYLMKASTTFYAGTLVCLNSDGLAVAPAALTGNQGCVGVCVADVTSAATGDSFVQVREGTFKLAATSVADTSVGLVVYATDNQTVDETDAGNRPKAGYLQEVVSSTSCWVAVGLGHHQAA